MNKLTVRDPFDALPSLIPQDFFNNFHKAFSDIMDFSDGPPVALNKGFPKGGVRFDDKGNAVIELALAGYSKDSLSVRAEDNKRLVISAQKQEREGETAIARRAFTKEFANFTNEWDLKAADVVYKNGLLSIVIPKINNKAEAAVELEIK